MTLKTLIFVILLSQFCANALKCKRCRGNACDDVIPVEDCEIQPKTLPYNFEDSSVGEDGKTKACVELLYVKDNKKFAVMQCIANSDNLCDRIRSSLPSKVLLENCKVESEVYYKNRVETTIVDTTDSASTESSAETETNTDTTEYSMEITTEGNSNIAVLSLFALIVSVVIHGVL
ncbi:hypothetical protein RN001_013417 [Aquatica leii]|uniref:Uncharacterized protein n=1 Tax=Aquatica leii TaxID=1421715 RepID=A0AAN7PRR3_9COLE|nr:hypothetical protein RN001_013417 [Aquatica leii]